MDVVEINTLQNALFMDRVNDLSFTIVDTLVEHQSTLNPDIALRLLTYMSKLYERMMDGKRVYSRKQMSIPRPEFIVLYNGKEEMPAESTLKLSGLYKKVKGTEGHEGVAL
ncbi:MAG: Rpn family recombination-promoting nuclease/putative transposase [Spirochaetaceae bacterium]|nr:Rpn family recombination-promoting nuclease/putative transposase [Spirochaetaceae bacterium]